MSSAIESLLSRSEYTFRVEHFTAEIASSQKDSLYQPRTDIHLRCERVSGDWPAELWPCRFRIVATRVAEYDSTKGSQLVLGMVRRDSKESVDVSLISSTELALFFLEALTQKHYQAFLKIETTRPVRGLIIEDWIAVLSFSLVLSSETPYSSGKTAG